MAFRSLGSLSLEQAFGGRDQRTRSGLTVKEVIREARYWWDHTGRFVVRNPEFRNPSLTPRSGILQGLEFSLCTVREQIDIVKQFHDNKLLPALQQGMSVEQVRKSADAGQAKKKLH